MRRAVVWLIDGLPFDARSRRVLDETLADWVHEEANATGRFAQWTTSLRAIAAVIRATAGVMAVEALHVPYIWLTARLFLFALVPATVVVLIGYADRLGQFAPELSRRVTTELTALCAPHETELLLPLAFFLAVLFARSRRVPAIGIALLAFALTLAVNVWLEPAANAQFARVLSEAKRPMKMVMGPLLHVFPPGLTTRAFADASPGFGLP